MNNTGIWATEVYGNSIFGMRVKQVLHSEQSKYQRVEIFDTFDWGLVLMLDGMMMVTERDEFLYHETIVHLPMSFLREPQRALIIGGGDGCTLRELQKYPSLQQIDFVEIDVAVIDACSRYLPFSALKSKDERTHILTVDGAAFVTGCADNYYDLIVSDSSDPNGFAEVLIGQTFYEHTLRILKPQGIFAAQTSSPILQRDELTRTWQNLTGIFPKTQIAWSVVPSYPGAVFSFCLASGHNSLNDFSHASSPPDCKFWKPKMIEGMLAIPSFMAELLPQKLDSI